MDKLTSITRPGGLVVQMLGWTPEGGVRSWSGKAWIQYVQDQLQDVQDQSQYVQHQQQYDLRRISLKLNLRKSQDFAKKIRGCQFYKENPLYEIYKISNFCSKKLGGVKFNKQKALKQNLGKSQNLAQKVKRGSILLKKSL